MSRIVHYARNKITLKSEEVEIVAGSGNPVLINGDAIVTTSALPPALSMAVVGSTPNANAGIITSGTLALQPADATHPGVVSTGAQTFGGTYTFLNNITAPNIGGGSISLAAIGSSPNNNGASLSGSTLNLQPADGTHGGVLLSSSQTLGGAKSFLGDVSLPNLALSSDTSKISQNGHSIYRTGDDLSLNNVYFGKDAGPLVPTVNARRNTCLGSQSGAGITDGNELTFVGNFSGNLHQDGGQSTFVGYSAGSNSLDCETCTFVGHQAASNVEHGSNLIAIGKDAGTNFAGFDADSIAIGHEGGGSNSIWLGQAGMTACRIAGIYGQTIQGGGLAVSIDVDNRLGTTVSSLKYKRKIEEVDGKIILGLRAKRFCMKNDPKERICYGFIAEEVEKIIPECIVYEEDVETYGEYNPKGIQHEKLWPLLQDVVRQQEARITEMENKMALIK